MKGGGKVDSVEKNKVRELLFFLLSVLVFIFSISYSAYAKNQELYDNRQLIMAYIMVIRPLIGVSFVLLSAGLLAKVGFLDVGRLSAKEKKMLFFIGLILIGILFFYMLLMGVLCTGLQYAGTDNWVKAIIDSELYNILYQPFRSTYYKEVYLLRDMIGIIGAFFLFLSKSKLGNGIVRERQDNNSSIGKAKVGQILFLGVSGLVFVGSVIFSIYAKYVANPAGEVDNIIMPAIIYLIWVKPLVFASTAILITGLLSKIGILNLAQLSAKTKKMLFIIGLALVVITVFYMLLLGVLCTGLQFTETENWVKAMIHSELYITLTQPFHSSFGEEMYLIRNIGGTIGALLLYITITKSKTTL